MTWTATSGIQVQNLLTQIGTDLTGTGWTLHDGGANNVYKSTNDQGVTQYVQITQVGSYQYLQFQAWQSWNAGTHAGTNGSGTSQHRLYFAGSAVGATTTVDLYTSVTANRFIIFIQGVQNYRHWAYFGGLDTLAGTSDPFCAAIVTGAEPFNTATPGNILQAFTGGSNWAGIGFLVPAQYQSGGGLTITFAGLTGQLLGTDSSQFVIFPIMVCDASQVSLRGNLDGVLYCPVGSGTVGHLDTISVGGTTYLVIVPGPNASGTIMPPITAAYSQALAIAEV